MAKRTLFIFVLSFLFIGLQSFHAPGIGKNDFNYEVAVSPDGIDFTKTSTALYNQFGLVESELSKDVFNKALKGYLYLRYTNELANNQFLTVLDFSKQSSQKRLWVFDLNSKQIVFNELVAHGKYSGDKFASSFSNRSNSKKSSLGFYVTGQPYNGRHRYSLKLRGLEPGFNSNAFARGIVMHGAHYVSQEIAEAQQSVGRSFGCPAVAQDVNKNIVDLIQGGSCLFLYHPQTYYNGKSKIINNKQFIPIELLNALVE
ncbi:MAG: murein L,D-transpeptidase catalytic domain family protein [Bacteroidetes bacterium]|jgi:hypothetical protein|nr:murein L,D-transpeptidase catalytic domain family protein [Bacteroidota bacterium]